MDPVGGNADRVLFKARGTRGGHDVDHTEDGVRVLVVGRRQDLVRRLDEAELDRCAHTLRHARRKLPVLNDRNEKI